MKNKIKKPREGNEEKSEITYETNVVRPYWHTYTT